MYDTRSNENTPFICFNDDFFKDAFFPSTITQWKKIDPSLQNSARYRIFKNRILKFTRPSPNETLQIATLGGQINNNVKTCFKSSS